MFSKTISSTSFTSGQANSIFAGSIQCDYYSGDHSFAALMRALLSKRIKNEDSVSCAIHHPEAKYALMAANPHVFLNESMLSEANTISIACVCGNEEERKRYFERIDRMFSEPCDGFREQPDLRLFVGRNNVMNARFYINDEKKKYYIVVDDCNLRKFHLLGAFIPRYLPWIFKDQPITEAEHNLLRSMMERTSANFESLIEEMYLTVDIRDMVIKSVIGGFEKRSRQVEIDVASEQMADVIREINRNRDKFRELITRQDTLNVRIAGLHTLMEQAGDSSELVDYFTSCKHLIPVNAEGSELSFVVNTYLDMVDPEAYNRVANNRTSYINRMEVRRDDFVPVENRRMLLDALFSDEPILRLKVCAYYVLDLKGYAYTESYYSFPAECRDRMPNPHLNYHRCLGDHERLITDCVRGGSMIGAVEQCIASAKSMNILEDLTAKPFISELFNDCNSRVIELPDGTSVTPVDALKWLKEQKTEDQ